jgi:hypothetical protein
MLVTASRNSSLLGSRTKPAPPSWVRVSGEVETDAMTAVGARVGREAYLLMDPSKT